jgi:ribosome assembly protein YihI (activator of Der GTPase)
MDQQQIMEILAKILESQNQFSQNQEAMGREINTINQKVNAMSQDFNFKQDVMNKKLEKIELTIEHDITVKISALYDSREVQKEHNVRVDETLDRIEKKVEVLQLETANLIPFISGAAKRHGGLIR